LKSKFYLLVEKTKNVFPFYGWRLKIVGIAQFFDLFFYILPFCTISK